MLFKRYDSFDKIEPLKDDWNQLLNNCASHVPFLTYEYQQTWWETLGGGEWPKDSELVLIAAFRDDQLIGVAPLFQTENILGKKALMFIGAIEVSDFLDFIVEPENLEEFITELVDFLTSSKDISQWEVLDLYNILEDSPTLDILQKEADRRGWDHKKVRLQPSPYVPLPGDFDEYLAGIDKKQRHEIRRKRRNLEQSLVESDFYVVEDQDALHAETQAFIDMMAQDPNKRDFLTDEMQQHIHNTVQTAFDNEWLHLAFLNLDGEKAAAYLSFNFNNRLWLYNSGWDWEYRDYSPGWVLLTYLLEWANENGITELDFMRGNEAYKYKFGGIDRHIFRVTLTP